MPILILITSQFGGNFKFNSKNIKNGYVWNRENQTKKNPNVKNKIVQVRIALLAANPWKQMEQVEVVSPPVAGPFALPAEAVCPLLLGMVNSSDRCISTRLLQLSVRFVFNKFSNFVTFNFVSI